MIRRAGKVSLPIAAPLFPGVTAAGRRLGLVDFSPDFRRVLRYGRAVDTTRLIEEVGYQPQFDSLGAVEDYVRTLGGRRMVTPLRETVVG
jgi:UDP-glucose 4-epimerase